MTPTQQAFAEGFQALAAESGLPCIFGSATFVGVASEIKPNDPRLAGSGDRLIEIYALTSSLPTPRPVNGDEFIQDGFYYRISRVDHIRPTGQSIFLVIECGEAPAVITSGFSDGVSDGFN